jgi:hypothetical protein
MAKEFKGLIHCNNKQTQCSLFAFKKDKIINTQDYAEIKSDQHRFALWPYPSRLCFYRAGYFHG